MCLEENFVVSDKVESVSLNEDGALPSSTNHHHQMDSSPQHPMVFYNDNPLPTPYTQCRHDENVYAEDYIATHANMLNIPPLIKDILVDAGNINKLLGCFDNGEYAPLLKFQTIAAALFPLWVEIDISKNAQDFPHKVSAACCALLALYEVI